MKSTLIVCCLGLLTLYWNLTNTKHPERYYVYQEVMSHFGVGE